MPGQRPASVSEKLGALSYILFFTGGLWGWWLYFSLLYFCGWFVRALLILYAWAAVLILATGLHTAQS